MKHCINATTSNELITTSNTTVQFSFDEKPANIKLLEQLILNFILIEQRLGASNIFNC